MTQPDRCTYTWRMCVRMYVDNDGARERERMKKSNHPWHATWLPSLIIFEMNFWAVTWNSSGHLIHVLRVKMRHRWARVHNEFKPREIVEGGLLLEEQSLSYFFPKIKKKKFIFNSSLSWSILIYVPFGRICLTFGPVRTKSWWNY